MTSRVRTEINLRSYCAALASKLAVNSPAGSLVSMFGLCNTKAQALLDRAIGHPGEVRDTARYTVQSHGQQDNGLSRI